MQAAGIVICCIQMSASKGKGLQRAVICGRRQGTLALQKDGRYSKHSYEQGVREGDINYHCSLMSSSVCVCIYG